MPISVVVGGQFGSEGKGKVAHYVAQTLKARYAIRVGGTNSGHTVICSDGQAIAFRHLPTACILPDVVSVIPPGHYVQVETLLSEIQRAEIRPNRLTIDPYAWVIGPEDVDSEKASGIGTAIGSTVTGTGAALVRRIERNGFGTFAKDVSALLPYIGHTSELLVDALDQGDRIVVEGTQGFGLSLLHSRMYPHCTSRDTTAAAFVSESGLSPMDVDDVVLVIRAFPIRVSGNSGALPNEISWSELAQESGHAKDLLERTTVTNRIRRVARFGTEVVAQAITHNRPSRIVLNHVDYVDIECARQSRLSSRAQEFVRNVEKTLGAAIDLLGISPSRLIGRGVALRRVGNE